MLCVSELDGRYFQKMIFNFSSPPFYTKFVHLPKADYELPNHFRRNIKLWPYFKNSLGAIDGSHIACAPPAAEH